MNDPESLVSRPDVGSIHGGLQDLVIEETELECGFPRGLETLLGPELLYRPCESYGSSYELAEVLSSEPPWSPHEICDTVVESVTIQIDRSVEVLSRPHRDEGLGD